MMIAITTSSNHAAHSPTRRIDGVRAAVEATTAPAAASSAPASSSTRTAVEAPPCCRWHHGAVVADHSGNDEGGRHDGRGGGCAAGGASPAQRPALYQARDGPYNRHTWRRRSHPIRSPPLPTPARGHAQTGCYRPSTHWVVCHLPACDRETDLRCCKVIRHLPCVSRAQSWHRIVTQRVPGLVSNSSSSEHVHCRATLSVSVGSANAPARPRPTAPQIHHVRDAGVSGEDNSRALDTTQ